MMPGKVIRSGTSKIPHMERSKSTSTKPIEKWKGRDVTSESTKDTGSSAKAKSHHSVRKMHKRSEGTTSFKEIPTLSITEKKAIAKNVNILNERKCQLITKEALLLAKKQSIDSRSEKMQDMSLENIITNKEIENAQEEYKTIENELNQLHLETNQIIDITMDILNPKSTNSHETEIAKFSDLITKDSLIGETLNSYFDAEVRKIQEKVIVSAKIGDNIEMNKLEEMLVQIYQNKYDDNQSKINILSMHPFEDVTVTNIGIKKNLRNLKTENSSFKQQINMLKDKIALRTSFTNEFRKVETLEGTLKHVNLNIDKFEKDLTGSEEVVELISRRKQLEVKLDSRLDKAAKIAEKLMIFLKNNSSEINAIELVKTNEKFNKLVSLSEELFENEDKQIKIAAAKLELKANEKPLKEIADGFSKTISELTTNWQQKSKSDQEEALKQINAKYDSYTKSWDEKKENVDIIKKIRMEKGIESQLLEIHDAIEATIDKLNTQFKLDGTIDKKLIFILKKVSNTSAGYSKTLLRSVAQISKVIGLAIVAGIVLALYMSDLFKKDKKVYQEEIRNVDSYDKLHHEVDDLMKYVDTVNSEVKGAIPLDKDILIIHSQAVKDHTKIKSRVDHLKNYFQNPSIEMRIEIGDALAHKIDEKYPNALIERDEKNNLNLGPVELLRNPWASKKFIEEYKESGEVRFHEKLEKKLAKFGLKVDNLVDYSLPEYVNFRKAYSSHAGISAEIRLIDEALVYDTEQMKKVKDHLLKSIREFEQNTKYNNENRISLASWWYGDTPEYIALGKGKAEHDTSKELREETKKLKEARNIAINKNKRILPLKSMNKPVEPPQNISEKESSTSEENIPDQS